VRTAQPLADVRLAGSKWASSTLDKRRASPCRERNPAAQRRRGWCPSFAAARVTAARRRRTRGGHMPPEPDLRRARRRLRGRPDEAAYSSPGLRLAAGATSVRFSTRRSSRTKPAAANTGPLPAPSSACSLLTFPAAAQPRTFATSNTKAAISPPPDAPTGRTTMKLRPRRGRPSPRGNLSRTGRRVSERPLEESSVRSLATL